MFRRRPNGWQALRRVGPFLSLAGLPAFASGCSEPAPRRPAFHQVVIQRFEFEPARLSIAPGDTVEWRNLDLVPHTATASSGRWDSDPIPPGAAWRAVFVHQGREPYICRLHPNMSARLEVRP